MIRWRENFKGFFYAVVGQGFCSPCTLFTRGLGAATGNLAASEGGRTLGAAADADVGVGLMLEVCLPAPGALFERSGSIWGGRPRNK